MSLIEKSISAVWEWNKTIPDSIDECVHRLFRKQARLWPDAVAVDAHDGTWTYQQLEDVSDIVARHLVSHLCIGPEDVVPLCFEKSKWAVVAILGVLKAGGAFVFLDPSHPEDRRRYIVTQVEAKVIITSPVHEHLYNASEGPRTIRLSHSDLDTLRPCEKSVPQEVDIHPSNLLYIVFTSGSTGLPKGVEIEHTAFLSGSLRHAERANIHNGTRILQLASFTFDVSMLEILTSLVHGACICMPDISTMSNGPAVLINQYKVTWTFMTPSLVKLMSPEMVPTLKTLALGGEPLSKPDVEAWAGHLQLINGYGPSECSVAATGNTEMTVHTDPSNIGYPVGGICWIVDANDHHVLLPPNHFGELLIEGPILARGYFKDEEQTARAFIERPAWSTTTKNGQNRRLYKTGDLAKFLDDGSILFLGRKDTQVKLRGFRIELSEIEHHIAAFTDVHHQVVLLPKKGLLANRLVAIVSLKEHLAASSDDTASSVHIHSELHSEIIQTTLQAMQEGISAKIPEYMVPEHWIVVNHFPLLTSGKLNRSLVSTWLANADEDMYRRVLGLGNKPNFHPEEADPQLLSIIAVVLGVSQAFIEESSHKAFLSIGGDSITAMQVAAKCRSFGLSLNVRDVMGSKSLAHMSRCIKRTAGPSIRSIEEQVDTPFALSPVQRMYFDLAAGLLEARQHVRFNQSFFLKIQRRMDQSKVEEALDTIVSRHSMLRVRFTRDLQTGTWLQITAPQAVREFSFASHKIGAEQEAYPVMAAVQDSLSLFEGPVFAAVHFDAGEGGQRLFLVAHHALIDLVSWRVILRDLEQILLNGSKSLTEERPLPFSVWLSLQADHARTLELSEVLPYDIPAPDLSYWGMSGTPNSAGDTRAITFNLDSETTKRLLEGDCHSAYRTEPIDLILASLVYSFGQTFTDRPAPPIFREGHGREPWDDSIDIADTVGWFTTMYPLLVNVKENDEELDILDVVKRAKDARRSVLDNGRPYFAARYLHEDGVAQFHNHDNVEISFDYLGLYQQMQRPGSLLTMVPGYQALFHDVGDNAPRFSLFEITAEILQDQFQALFVFNKKTKRQDRIESWVNMAEICLTDVIDRLENQARDLTLSDVSLLNLSYEDLDVMVSKTLPRVGIQHPDNVESIYPISAMQNGLLLGQLRPGHRGAYEYNQVLNVSPRLDSETLDTPQLISAWEEVVKRHTSLRTVFVQSAGGSGLYDQLVLEKVSSPIVTYQCHKDQVMVFLDSQDRLGFHEGEILHRLTICQTSSNAATCRLEINHAVVDGSSMDNILGDLLSAYDGRLSSQRSFAFEDYIAHIQKIPMTASADFWVEYLSGVNPTIFPSGATIGKPIKSEAKLGVARLDVDISPAELSNFCDASSVSWVNVFQLAWGLVLRQYTGSDDVCFGYLSSGRDAPLDGIEGGVGAFLNMLVTRMIFDKTSTMIAVLAGISQDVLSAMPHQYYGLANIQHTLGLSDQALFNTIISYHRDSDHDSGSEFTLEIETMESHDPTEYTLSLDVGLSGSRISVSLQFFTDDFTLAQAEDIGATYAEAIKAIVRAQPGSLISQLRLTGRHHIDQLRRINAIYPSSVDECVHQAIERQAREVPDHEAICSYEGSWSRGEIDKLSSHLAHHLVQCGVGPEVIVAYCFPKSAYAIISILAILKAGGAAVALDPGHPVERLHDLINQCESRVILTDRRLVENFAHIADIEHVLAVDGDLFARLGDQSSTSDTPQTGVKPENACFVVFTSGTTGRPKGIVLEHRNLRTCIASMGPVLGFGPDTRALQFAAYVFDISLQDILTTLTLGGTVCVISDDQRVNDLAGGINATQANLANLTATVSGLLNPADVPTLRRINNAGEALTRDVIEKWAERGLCNGYGPAETTINLTATGRLLTSSSANNIGPAYASHVWIVDAQDHNTLIPIGCTGEILIEGPLLARGYLKDAEKSNAVFINDPAWVSLFQNPAAPVSRRMYRTGDLGIMNEDGSITIAGRHDSQVKVNGQRVELDEIMHQAQRFLPEGYRVVLDASSIKETTQSKTIIAFITVPGPDRQDHGQIDVLVSELPTTLESILKEVANSLARTLPSYMIPSFWIPILEIPTTTSGKLDRAKLRVILSHAAKTSPRGLTKYALQSSQTNDQPQNCTEEALQALFSLVLDIDVATIGREDSFFALGGDSVGAMKLVAAARKQDLVLQVANIFKYPFLSALAAVTDAMKETDEVDLQMLETYTPFSMVDAAWVTEAAAQCKLEIEEVDDVYPTSPLQEGMMALGLRNRGAYITQIAARIPFTSDVSRIRAAWEIVVRAQDILRTRIVVLGVGKHMQVVAKQPPSWTIADDMNLESYLSSDKATFFEYGEPLMRLALLRQQSDSATYFVWTGHHAVYDSESMSSLFDKVHSECEGITPLPSLPFKHFIKHLGQINEQDAKRFWDKELGGHDSSPVSFPPNSNSRSKPSLGRSATKVSLHGRAANASSSGVLDSTIKRAAWAMTLASFCDSSDVVFAQTLSGRGASLPGIDMIMGPTITTVPVRVCFPPWQSSVTVKEFLASLQATALEATAYEHLGLQTVRDISEATHDVVDSINNLFVIQPYHSGPIEFPMGMQLLTRDADVMLEYYPLTVLCNLTGDDAYTVEALFDQDAIDAGKMTRILRQFEHVVQELSSVSSMDQPVSQLSLLNAHDLKQISTWNEDLASCTDGCIPDLISRKAACQPESEAVCAWDGRLTYRDLDLVTAKLSNFLTSLGVRKEVKVCLCFDKSMWNLVAMYAVMRTGGVCVPLLPSYPRARITDILEDTQASLVLVSPQCRELFDKTNLNVVSIDQVMADSLPASALSPPKIDPEDAAFIVFTSGSTGRPKGVIIEHRGFCTMAHHQLPELKLYAESRVLQFATHTFDICLFESFAPLLAGACVCIPSEHQRMNSLIDAITAFRVDWMIMVSTIAETFAPDDVPLLKTLVLGGEPLRADIHARWAARVNLFNAYGPAECSILAVMTRSTIDTLPSMIGKGCGGRTWVVDKEDHHRLVPVGCIGELLIEGPILARGYLNDHEKTTAAYVLNPAWISSICPLDTSPRRFYKTGDLVYYDENGNLSYIGRKDTQIKIRGLRVELGEIEHHLNISSLSTHKQAVEKVLLGGSIDKACLAAFVVLPASFSDTMSTPVDVDGLFPWSATVESAFTMLQQHLGEILPNYMVPTLYIPLWRMPETSTNKIDRNALRRLGAGLSSHHIELYSLSLVHRSAASAINQAPSTSMELLLQELWSQILNIEQTSIGAHDDFFARGGDSIKAMRLTSSARSHNVSLLVADIFQNPVLSKMALVAGGYDDRSRVSSSDSVASFALIRSPQGSTSLLIDDAAAQCLVPSHAIQDMYPCTSLQEGLMELATQREGAYTAQRVFRLHDDIDVRRFQAAWSRLVAMHPILRTRIVLSPLTGEAIQVVIDEDITWQGGTALDEYLAVDKSRAVQYGSPLARYALDREHHHFVWTVHHALYDGHSANLVMRQLGMLYHGQHLDPPETGFNAFIKATVSNTEHRQKSQSFWGKRLGEAAPASFPRLPSASYQSRADCQLTKTIDMERSTRSRSPFMLSTILRSAWAIVTSRHMGSHHIAFAVTNSGRNAAIQGIETVVGPTIATVPLHTHAANDMTAEQFLSQVQQHCIDMMPFEHFGIQNIFATADQKHNLRNLFVIQQSLDSEHDEGKPFMDEVHDESLLRGFHFYPVVVECILHKDDQVQIEIQFDQLVLPEYMATVVMEQFEHVIHQLCNMEPSSPGLLLEDIELSPSRHYQQMVAWNELVAIKNVEDSVHNIFRAQVSMQPDAEAVTSSWEGSLTYQQLDTMSDMLAIHLVQKGVPPETMVPLCFNKSIYTVVAMMATLKTGGACVHLGAKTPVSRIMEILPQTESRIVLTDVANSQKIQELALPIQTIVVHSKLFDSLPGYNTILSLPSGSHLPHVSPNSPAFVLFTSGSTGTPKGVVVEHGSLCTSSRAHGTNRKVGPHTRLFQFAAYTFDVSVADIFTTLQRGGCICVPSEADRIDDIAGAISRLNCNYAFLTPTVAGMISPEDVPSLKTLILGGELLTHDNIQRWAKPSGVDLIISYGMTECSIHCVDAVPLTIHSDPATLGRPSGCHMWIVDAANFNKLAPIGAVGELVIEGRVVSRGYLNDKKKTDSAFIINPAWTAVAGLGTSEVPRRLYLTGDLCRYNAQGEICYVSRKDFQVKHHGQRIELGDIEHHIVSDELVHQTIVLLPSHGHFQNKLVAVLSLESLSKSLSPATQLTLVSATVESGFADAQVSRIRSHLATKVTDYMVPSIWIIVQALPLTPNNKLDRIATSRWLEQMDRSTYQSIVGGDAEAKNGTDAGMPATAQQKILHDTLASILGLSSINMHRSFLDLGGDSITAMQLRAKSRAARLLLTVPIILTCESIFDLASKARVIKESTNATGDFIGLPLPVTGWQQHMLEQNSSAFHAMDTRLVTPKALITVPRLLRAIEALVQQHDSLRTRFSRKQDGRWVQVITQGPSSSYYNFDAETFKSMDEVAPLISALGKTNAKETSLLYLRLFGFDQAASETVERQVIAISFPCLVTDVTSRSLLTKDLASLLDGNSILDIGNQSLASLLASERSEVAQPVIAELEPAKPDILSSQSPANGVMAKVITLDHLNSTALLTSSNDAFSTQPCDILTAAVAAAWHEVYGTPASSIALGVEFRPLGAIGQFSRLRQIPKLEGLDIVQMLTRVKDASMQENLFDCLMRPVPRFIDVLIDSVGAISGAGSEHDYQILDPIRAADLSASYARLHVSLTVFNDQVSLRFRYRTTQGRNEQGLFASIVQAAEQSICRLLATLSHMPRRPTLIDIPSLQPDYDQLERMETMLADIAVPFSNVEAIVPCTPLQEHMLDSQRRTPGSYQSDTVHRITSGGRQVNVPSLQRAFTAVTARHEALRTILIPSVCRPECYDQIVLRSFEPFVQVLQCEEDEVAEGLIRRHHSVDHRAMKPHIALTLFQTQSSLFSKFEISHALQDGASTRIIYQDLVEAYLSASTIYQTMTAAPAFRQYAGWLEAHVRDTQAASAQFWTQYLSPLTKQPFHIPRKPSSSSQGEHILMPISIDAHPNAIAKLCRRHAVTPSTFFQAAWAVCLKALCNSDTVLVVNILADRDADVPSGDVDRIVGPLLNMVGCWVQVADSSSGRDVLSNVNKEFLETLPYQHGFVTAATTMEREIRSGDHAGPGLPWNSALSVEYVNEPDGVGYFPTSALDAAGEGGSLAFEVVYGSRAPEFDVVLGVLVGRERAEVQLGYWNGVMDSGSMENLASMYRAVVLMWL